MDQKTYEYMQERADKYRDLKSRRSNLVKLSETISSPKCDDIQLYIDGNHRGFTSYMNSEQKKRFKTELSTLIEKYAAELEKEMEAI